MTVLASEKYKRDNSSGDIYKQHFISQSTSRGTGIEEYEDRSRVSTSTVIVHLHFEVNSDEFSKQMELAKKIMKKNQVVLKRLAE